MVVFALMALIPGGLVYAISFQFLQRSIESWFDVRVDESLNRGIKLARNAMEASLKDLERKAEAMANSLAASQAVESTTLNRLREQHSIEEATLLTPRGKILAQSGSEPVALLPDLPSPNVLRQVRAQQKVSAIENIGERGLYLRAIVPVNVLTIADDIRILQVLQRVPQVLAQDAQLVEAGLQDYQAAAARARGPEAHLRPHAHARHAAHPLLGAGARLRALGEALGAAVGARRGHARHRQGRLLEAEPGEEPRRVRRAHAVVQHHDAPDRRCHRGDGAQPAAAGERQDLPREHPLEPHVGRAHLRRAPVREDDERGRRTTSSAVPAGAFHGIKLSEWPRHVQAVAPFAEIALRHFAASGMRQWEEQMEYRRADGPRTLLLRGTRLGQRGENGYVVVFDDITHLIQAQRDAAWGEVARRLAHEIKNPLTPIQLSAERLQHKLQDKLPRAEADDAAAAPPAPS